MQESQPPTRPLMIFDGDCGFCQRSVERLRRITGDRIDYAPAQAVGSQFPQIPPERFAHAVQLVEPDGRITQGAEAVFGAMACRWYWRWPRWLYAHVPGVATASEKVYAFIARHRGALSGATGGACSISPPTRNTAVRWFFLRLLGVVYLTAFWSLGTQIIGLVGKNGILPAEQFLKVAAEHYGEQRFSALPTICWWDVSDQTITFLCRCGVIASILLILDIAPALVLIALFALYLSLASICQVFLHFQWDILLLETGFLAIWLAPLSIRPRLRTAATPSWLAIWAVRLLTFKLMFSSGIVKITWNDPTWRDLTAMTYHYWSQPIPSWISWYADHAPLWVHKFEVVLMYAIEIGAPFLMFFGRRARLVAFLLMSLLQIAIGVTGNYGFFNLLSIVLCVSLLDDRMLPAIVRRRFEPAEPRGWRWPAIIAWPIVLAVTAFSIIPLSDAIIGPREPGRNRHEFWPEWVQEWSGRLSEWHIVGGYGLFRSMTTTRPEIIVEGSDDLRDWKTYEFRYKPGDVKRPPPIIGLHMPRLDWQMWFAALRYPQSYDRWFVFFCRRLVDGSPEVLALLERNPFPDTPPRYIRATVYDYHFTTAAERNQNGAWWKRELLGPYCPIIQRTVTSR